MSKIQYDKLSSVFGDDFQVYDGSHHIADLKHNDFGRWEIILYHPVYGTCEKKTRELFENAILVIKWHKEEYFI